MPDLIDIIYVIPFMLVIILIGLAAFLFIWRPRVIGSNPLHLEDDPRQQINRNLLIAMILAHVFAIVAAWLSGIAVNIDLVILIGWISMLLLISRRPRLVRYSTVFFFTLSLCTFGFENLFLPSGLILLASPVIVAGLLFELWEMAIFMLLMIGAYSYGQSLFGDPVLPNSMGYFGQIAFIFLGFIASMTSFTLTRAFYRERALRKAQEQMLRTVCHELRTPVAAMRSFWAATRMEGMDVSLGALEPLAEDVQRHTDYLHQLTEQVVQIVRARQTTQTKEWVDLAETARRSVSQMALLTKTKGMNLSLQVSEEPLKIWGTNEWQTVLVNLVDNALRHSHGTQIEVRVERQQGVPVLIVRDDGRGLPLELHLLIQPWVRHDQESSRGVSQGLGLGWTIIQDICQRNQARIQAGQGIDGKGLGVTIAFNAPGWASHWIVRQAQRMLRP